MAGTNYVRQSTFADGDIITSALFNNEYNQIVNAFAYSTSGITGHTHDGSVGQGGNIPKIGDQDFQNKIEVDNANNRWGFFVEVGGTAAEQLRIQDGALLPVVDSDIDLGSSSLYFKDSYIDTVTTTGNITAGGTVVAANLTVGGIGLTSTITELNILDGITATTDELNYSDGVTSSIQTQLNNKQPLDAQLTDIASLTPTNGTFIVGDGANFIAETPAIALASLGLTAVAAELNVLDGIITTNAELNFVHNVSSNIQNQLDVKQPLNDRLTDVAGLIPSANYFIAGTGSNFVTRSPTEVFSNLGITATAAELNYVDGVTGPIQSQINTLVTADSPTFIGTVTAPILNVTTTFSLGGQAVTSTAAELNTLDGVTVTAAEINYLSGATSNLQTQINQLQTGDTDLEAIAALTPLDSVFIVGNGTTWISESGATARTSLGLTIGTDVQAYDSNLTSFVSALTLPSSDGVAGQALLTDGSGVVAFGDVDALPAQAGNSGYYLTTDGTDPSWAALLYVDNLTSDAQAQLDAIPKSLTDLSVTSTASELNILDGATLSTAELNILDGATLSTAELNILNGATLSTAELNILDGATLTTVELNYLDGATSNLQTQINTLDPFPSQATNDGKYLQTNGTSLTWAAVESFAESKAYFFSGF